MEIAILSVIFLVALFGPSISSKIDKIKSDKVFNQKILMVEDSVLLSKEIYDCLNIAGYKNIIQAKNGK